MSFIGYRIVRYRDSFFLASRFIRPDLFLRNQNAHALVRRFNLQFPDPEEQKRLSAELAQKYPPSRLRTLGGLIVFGAGAWLVLTALSGIIQWLLSRYLDVFFPK